MDEIGTGYLIMFRHVAIGIQFVSIIGVTNFKTNILSNFPIELQTSAKLQLAAMIALLESYYTF